MAFRIATAFIDYIPALAAGAGVVTNRPVSNVEGYVYPLRTWRSATTGATDKQVILDFTTTPTIRHLFIGNVNFSSVLVDVADNAAMSGATSHGSFTLNIDRRVNRRKAWLSFASPVAKRYLRLTPNSVVGGASFYEIGVVACFDAIIELIDDPSSPWRYVRGQAQTRTEFASGGEDVSEDGVAHLREYTLNFADVPKSGVETQLADVMDAGPSGPVCLFENLGDSSKAYICRRVNEVETAEEVVVFSQSLLFREAI